MGLSITYDCNDTTTASCIFAQQKQGQQKNNFDRVTGRSLFCCADNDGIRPMISLMFLIGSCSYLVSFVSFITMCTVVQKQTSNRTYTYTRVALKASGKLPFLRRKISVWCLRMCVRVGWKVAENSNRAIRRLHISVTIINSHVVSYNDMTYRCTRPKMPNTCYGHRIKIIKFKCFYITWSRARTCVRACVRVCMRWLEQCIRIVCCTVNLIKCTKWGYTMTCTVLFACHSERNAEHSIYSEQSMAATVWSM